MPKSNTDQDLAAGRDLGMTGNYAISDADGDQFPTAYQVSLRSMVVKALDLKRQFAKDYWIVDARTLKVLWSTRGKDPGEEPEAEPENQVVASGSLKGRMILGRAERLKRKHGR